MSIQSPPDGPPGPLGSMDAARSAVAALIDGGMRTLVVSPGSRSAPMAYALAEASDAGLLELHVRIDERAAGFTALGLALGSQRPVGVLTTSGTAVGELLPAVMEANHAGVPLVVFSADRPEELRGTGANQTTYQPGLFGRHVRFDADVAAGRDPAATVRTALFAAQGFLFQEPGADRFDHPLAGLPENPQPGPGRGVPGPVQVNLSFRDPLVPVRYRAAWSGAASLETASSEVPFPDTAPLPVLAPPGSAVPAGPELLELPSLGLATGELPQRRTVVVAGHGATALAEAFARDHGLPLLAEPSSNARFGPNAAGPYRLLLEYLGPEIERVVLFGRATLSRPVEALLAGGTPSALFAPEPVAWFDAGRRPERIIEEITELSIFAGRGPASWLALWQEAAALAAGAIDRTLAAEADLSGPVIARLVWEHTRGNLVLGSSNPIRDVDLTGAPAARPRARVFANRGLAGIDGTISTAIGIALAAPGPTTVLLGDVTFLHDAGGLFLGPGERAPGLRMVVVNDAGGGIFSLLEHGAVAERGDYGAAVERLFGTPQQVDLAALARAYGVGHRAVSGAAELARELAAPVSGRSILEVRTDRAGLRALHAGLHRAVAGIMEVPSGHSARH